MNVRRRRLSGDLEGERDDVRVVDDLDDEAQRSAGDRRPRRTGAAGAASRRAVAGASSRRAAAVGAQVPIPEPAGRTDAHPSRTAAAVAGSAAESPATDGKKPGKKPLYPRLLRLQHIKPNAWQRAALGEGAIGVGVLLAMADLASAWGIVVLPVAVAAVVKAHDALQGLLDPRDRPDDQPDQPTDRNGDATVPRTS